MANYKVQPEPLPISKVCLGEGPHWDEKTQSLYYVDILGKSVHRYHPQTKQEFKVVVQEKGEGHDSVTLVVPVENEPNKFVISLGRSLRVLEWDGKSTTGSASKTLKVATDGNLNGRFNDGKCDSAGRLWAGTMGFYESGKIDALEPKVGIFYKLDENGEMSKHLDSLDISNGLAWSKDNKIFYFVDSFTYRVDAFDFDAVTGAISNRRTVFDFKANNVSGIPDGMCIDESGNLWLAVFSGGKVLHIDPVAGKLLGQIDLPTSNTTSVTFGGPNLDILYITSAQNDLNEDQLKAQPYAGSVFQVTNLGVKGLSSGVAYRGKI